jgi:hypothetical protein
LALWELEFVNTQAVLDEFQRKYAARISPLERRLAELQIHLNKVLEARRKNANTKGESFQHQSEKSKSEEHQYDDKFSEEQNILKKENGELNPALEEELRALFRELAKSYHPDLTMDEYEKKSRQEMMARVSQAYTARDLTALRKLAEKAIPLPRRPYYSRQEEKSRLKAEVAYLDEKIADLERKCRELDNSPAMLLRLEVNRARQSGRDLLSDMAAKLKARIADIEAQLQAYGVDKI